VKRYVRRNKTNRADAAALTEAARREEVHLVPVKCPQLQILALHRLRTQWMSTGHRYINVLRRRLREFGVAKPLGARAAHAQVARELRVSSVRLPAGLRPPLRHVLNDLEQLEQRILSYSVCSRGGLRQCPPLGAALAQRLLDGTATVC